MMNTFRNWYQSRCYWRKHFSRQNIRTNKTKRLPAAHRTGSRRQMSCIRYSVQIVGCPPASPGEVYPPQCVAIAWGGIPPSAAESSMQQQRGGGHPPQQVMRNVYASWYIMHIDGYACISMDMHAYPWICIHGYACIFMDMHASAILPKIQESP